MPPTGTTARRTYTEQQRTEALATYADHGLAAAHRQHGIPKGTLTGWAARAGIDTTAANARTADQTREAAKASVAARAVRIAALNDQTVDLLAQIRVTALEATVAVLRGGVKDPKGDVRKRADWHPALWRAKPTELVGIWTRATHDLQLLTGEATGKVDTSGLLEVVFTAPRPLRRALGSEPTTGVTAPGSPPQEDDHAG